MSMSSNTEASSLPIDDFRFYRESTARDAFNMPAAEMNLEIASWLDGEQLELYSQHGISTMLMHKDFQRAVDWTDPSHEESYRLGMIEELGDILWFVDLAAQNNGVDFIDAANESLRGWGYYGVPAQTFTELDVASAVVAPAVSVPTKSELQGWSENKVALTESPDYVLNRMVSRLSRSLHEGKFDLPPFSASELEPIYSVQQSVGDWLIACSYVAQSRLGVSLDDVWQYNITKLTERAAWGKPVE
jgi:NTP pyrophosphatase (non-canonical NTP hydrolase)